MPKLFLVYSSGCHIYRDLRHKGSAWESRKEGTEKVVNFEEQQLLPAGVSSHSAQSVSGN